MILLPAQELLVSLANGFQLLRRIALFAGGDEVRTGCGRTFAEILHAVFDYTASASVRAGHNSDGWRGASGF